MNSYFSHDSNARNDEKIALLRMKHGSAYGVYFMILERLREAKDYMSVKDYNLIAFDLREDSQLIKSVVEEFGLFTFVNDKNRGECFYSKSFNDRMKLKDEKSQRRAEAGKKGAAKRWGSKDKAEPSNNDSNAMAKPSEKIASKEKESKVNKSKKDSADSPKKLKPDFSEDSIEFQLADYLYQKILEHNSDLKKPNLQKWADTIRLMIERDHRKPGQIKNMIDWAQSNDFWWPNILSATKLRSQYDTLKSQALAETQVKIRSSGKNVRESLPDWADDGYQHEHKPVDQDTVDEVKAQMARLKQEQAQEA
jgi:hypothetical protein